MSKRCLKSPQRTCSVTFLEPSLYFGKLLSLAVSSVDVALGSSVPWAESSHPALQPGGIASCIPMTGGGGGGAAVFLPE